MTLSAPPRGIFRAIYGLALAGAWTASVALLGCDRPGGQPYAIDATATTGGVCLGPCFADPGSAPADCSLQDQVDTLPIESFDNFPGNDGLSAQDLYTYTDGTATLLFTNYNGDLSDAGGWEPPVTAPPASIAPCNSNSDAEVPGVLHIFGGPFLGWGGGFGVAMAKLNGSDPMNTGTAAAPNYVNVEPMPNADPSAPKAFCCASRPDGGCQPAKDNAKFTALCPPPGSEFAVSIASVNASAYDGVSFWARRGTNGQAGLRINVADKYTDDDLNYLAQRQQVATGKPQPIYCNRNRECDCTNHMACEPVTTTQLGAAGNEVPPSTVVPSSELLSFCGIPSGLDLVSSCGNNTLICVGLNGGPSACCEQTNCTQPYPPYPCDELPEAGAFAGVAGSPGDIQYYNRPCTPYAWDNGISGSYCYNPATDPPPSPPTELCGDFWMTTVTLDTNWQFYMVPFSDLHQQGFAKKADHIDLASVSQVRFTFDIGLIDYWIDSLSFYRQK